MKKIIGLVVLSLVVMGLIVGCGQVQPSGSISVAALQGSWTYTYQTTTATYAFTNNDYVYESNAGGGMYNSTGIYSISGSTITFTKATGYDIGARDASISGNILTFTNDGVSTNYIKQ